VPGRRRDGPGDLLLSIGCSQAVPIGSGGSRVQYRAVSRIFDRVVAMKILTLQVADERVRRRFQRELPLTGRSTGQPKRGHRLRQRVPCRRPRLRADGALPGRVVGRSPGRGGGPARSDPHTAHASREPVSSRTRPPAARSPDVQPFDPGQPSVESSAAINFLGATVRNASLQIALSSSQSRSPSSRSPTQPRPPT
jgi:hypothetical protein